jgi:hypothetical protein
MGHTLNNPLTWQAQRSKPKKKESDAKCVGLAPMQVAGAASRGVHALGAGQGVHEVLLVVSHRVVSARIPDSVKAVEPVEPLRSALPRVSFLAGKDDRQGDANRCATSASMSSC